MSDGRVRFGSNPYGVFGSPVVLIEAFYNVLSGTRKVEVLLEAPANYSVE